MEDLSLPEEPMTQQDAEFIAFCVICNQLVSGSRQTANIVAESHSRETGHRTFVNRQTS